MLDALLALSSTLSLAPWPLCQIPLIVMAELIVSIVQIANLNVNATYTNLQLTLALTPVRVTCLTNRRHTLPPGYMSLTLNRTLTHQTGQMQ